MGAFRFSEENCEKLGSPDPVRVAGAACPCLHMPRALVSFISQPKQAKQARPPLQSWRIQVATRASSQVELPTAGLFPGVPPRLFNHACLHRHPNSACLLHSHACPFHCFYISAVCDCPLLGGWRNHAFPPISPLSSPFLPHLLNEALNCRGPRDLVCSVIPAAWRLRWVISSRPACTT